MTQSTSFKSARLLGLGAVALTGIVLAACSGFESGHPGNPLTEDSNLNTARQAASGGSGFGGDLAQNYYALASNRAQKGDKVDADYWARKSIAAAKGTAVEPESLRQVAELTPVPPAEGAKQEAVHGMNWSIPGIADPAHSGNVQVLADARQKLMTLLGEGARDRFPTRAARTQAYFDCSIERAEANNSDSAAQSCWTGFVRDYTDLYVLMHPPGQANAYFDYNSATLTPAGQKQIADSVAYIKDGTAKLAIVGKADRSGTDKYNMSLSHARAQAIHDAAVSDGLSADRVNVEAVGESQPPVPTKDGVKEARNRVVEIDTILPAAQVAALTSIE